MRIEDARKLRVGSLVMCPPDRGVSGFSGRVVYVGGVESVDMVGRPYIWVTVERMPGVRAVWPSNRLGVICP